MLLVKQGLCNKLLHSRFAIIAATVAASTPAAAALAGCGGDGSGERGCGGDGHAGFAEEFLEFARLSAIGRDGFPAPGKGLRGCLSGLLLFPCFAYCHINK